VCELLAAVGASAAGDPNRRAARAQPRPSPHGLPDTIVSRSLTSLHPFYPSPPLSPPPPPSPRSPSALLAGDVASIARAAAKQLKDRSAKTRTGAIGVLRQLLAVAAPAVGGQVRVARAGERCRTPIADAPRDCCACPQPSPARLRHRL
jgi:hypothetical protein